MILKKMVYTLLIVVAILISIKGYFYFDNRQFELQLKKNIFPERKVISEVAHKNINMDNFVIHYFASGKKENPLIVFLHPAYGDHQCFNQQIDFFSQKFFVITLDLPGHGLSQIGKSKSGIEVAAHGINKILDQEGKSTAHLVGVSLGSLVAQDFVYQFPDKVISLTSVGGYDLHSPIQEKEKTKKAQGKEIFKMISTVIFSMNSFRQYLSQISVYTAEAQRNVYEITKSFTRSSFRAMKNFSSLMNTSDTTHLPCPLLIINGKFEKEPLAIELSEAWHKRKKNSQFLMIPNAGHCANMDQPDAFNRIVEKFIAETTTK